MPWSGGILRVSEGGCTMIVIIGGGDGGGGQRHRTWGGGGGGQGGSCPPNENIGGRQTYRFAPPPNNFDYLKN